MADNTVLNSGTGGDTIASDDIGGVKYQRVKLSCGADGSATDVPVGGGVEAAALRVTIASDSTGVVSIDDNGASLTVDNAALSVTGGGVEASAMRVTIASDSTGVLSVDDNGASLTVDNAALSVTGGGVEASALRVTIASDSTGVLSIDDNGGSITVDGTVAVSGTVTVGSHAVTNAGTFAVQVDGSALTSLQLIDDAIVADDAAFTPATTKVMMAGFEYDDTAPDSVDEGDAGAARMSANRNQYMQIRDAAGNERGVNVNASNQMSVSVDAALPAGTNAIGKLASNTGVTIGAVEIAAAQTLATVTTCSTVTTLTGAGIAHDGADSGNPHKIGAKAETALSGITLVADGDRSDLYCGVDGVLIVRPECNLEDVVQERTTNTDGASTAFASGLAAPGAGIRLWVKSVDICNSSASFCTVDLRDGAAGSVLWTLPVPATGGVVKTFNPPLKLTANTALAFDASAAISTLTISANGFKSKV